MSSRMKKLAIRTLWLAAVLPALLLLPAGVASADDQLFEYYVTSPGGGVNIGGGQRVVQTFTAASDHPVNKVELYLDNPYWSQSTTVSILECGPGDPGTWSVLTSVTFTAPVTTYSEWVLVEGLSCDLEEGLQYAVFATTSDVGMY